MEASSVIRVIATPAPLRALALAAAGAAAAALPLAGLPRSWAAAAGVALLVAGLPRLGFTAAAALVPVAAIFGGGWLAWAGWSLAGLGLAAALALDRDLERRRHSRRHRDAVAKAREVHDRLARHAERWPLLLESCLELSSARELGQFARALERHARTAAPEALAVQVWLTQGDRLSCLVPGADQVPGDDERFAAQEARVLVRRHRRCVRLHVPLRGERRRDGSDLGVQGVLVVDLPDSPAGERSRELLLALGRLGGLGLAAVDLVDQARALALHDDLTGLFGRQEFLRRLEELSAAGERAATPLALLAVDLDHLKSINDRFGHAAGDQALKATAEALRRVARDQPGAVACRWGGEEFALALPDTGLERAALLGDRIRLALIEQAPLAGVPVRCSVGAVVRRPGERVADFLARADHALYQAKAQGRDRVVAEGGDAPSHPTVGETTP